MERMDIWARRLGPIAIKAALLLTMRKSYDSRRTGVVDQEEGGPFSQEYSMPGPIIITTYRDASAIAIGRIIGHLAWQRPRARP
ncbi:hypothetical protein VTK73DRAFT_3827 [Phialemonium thermophilum]|uniref:Uncharacterized protein n=1 Tax=Phialemonium thermophilum TaxID=223376 RepID=A0ABR3VE84_9PEZI